MNWRWFFVLKKSPSHQVSLSIYDSVIMMTLNLQWIQYIHFVRLSSHLLCSTICQNGGSSESSESIVRCRISIEFLLLVHPTLVYRFAKQQNFVNLGKFSHIPKHLVWLVNGIFTVIYTIFTILRTFFLEWFNRLLTPREKRGGRITSLKLELNSERLASIEFIAIHIAH